MSGFLISYPSILAILFYTSIRSIRAIRVLILPKPIKNPDRQDERIFNFLSVHPGDPVLHFYPPIRTIRVLILPKPTKNPDRQDERIFNFLSVHPGDPVLHFYPPIRAIRVLHLYPLHPSNPSSQLFNINHPDTIQRPAVGRQKSNLIPIR